MHGLGLCIKVDSYVAHFFMYSHSVMIQQFQSQNKILSLNTNTTVFFGGAGNSNKNGMQ